MSDNFHRNGPRRVGQVKEVTSLANPIIKVDFEESANPTIAFPVKTLA